MNRKGFVVLIILCLLVFLLWPRAEKTERPIVVQQMPWQVEFSGDGHSQVLGLEIGRTTPSQASDVFEQRGELALFADKEGTLSAESFFSELTTGGLSGRVILTLMLEKSELEVMATRAVKRKVMDTGSIKYIPNREDRLRLLDLPIVSITYIPYIDLDMELIESRFGVAEERAESPRGQIHLLYPSRGMEIIYDQRGKEVIQYVNRDDFSRLKAPLDEQSRIQ